MTKICSFEAALKSGGKPIKVGREGDGEIVLEVSASEIAEVLKLLTCQGTFRVTVEEGD